MRWSSSGRPSDATAAARSSADSPENAPGSAITAARTRTASEPMVRMRRISFSLGLLVKSDRTPRAPCSSERPCSTASAIGIHRGGAIGAMAAQSDVTHGSHADMSPPRMSGPRPATTAARLRARARS